MQRQFARFVAHGTRHTSHVTLFKVHRLVFPEHPPDARSFPFPDFQNSFSVPLDNFRLQLRDSCKVWRRGDHQQVVAAAAVAAAVAAAAASNSAAAADYSHLKHCPGSRMVPRGYGIKATHSLTTTRI